MTCAEVQDRLPDRAAGRLSAEEAGTVDRHLEDCVECLESLATVTLLVASRPAVPQGLEARIRAAVREAAAMPEPASATPSAGPGSRGWASWLRPAWALPLAAVLALAVGVPVVLSTRGDAPEPAGVLALADGEAGLWFDDDLMVAGAPALSELSDDALAELLEELER